MRAVRVRGVLFRSLEVSRLGITRTKKVNSLYISILLTSVTKKSQDTSQRSCLDNSCALTSLPLDRVLDKLAQHGIRIISWIVAGIHHTVPHATHSMHFRFKKMCFNIYRSNGRVGERLIVFLLMFSMDIRHSYGGGSSGRAMRPSHFRGSTVGAERCCVVCCVDRFASVGPRRHDPGPLGAATVQGALLTASRSGLIS